MCMKMILGLYFGCAGQIVPKRVKTVKATQIHRRLVFSVHFYSSCH